MTSSHLIITDKPTDIVIDDIDYKIVSASDYINTSQSQMMAQRSKVINLCANYDYLSKGYYCSLMAEGRGQRCIPSAQDIIKLHWKRLYQTSLPELNTLLEKTYKESVSEDVEKTILVNFGRIEKESLQPIARRIFDIFRFPIIAVKLKYTTKWSIHEIEARSLDDIPNEMHPAFFDSLKKYTGAAWSKRFKPSQEKYWLAVLHNPKERMPPSNAKALQKLVTVGQKMNCFVDLITKQDLPTLLEYDALFIRETTAIENHTYRFADKAESEGIPAIDDTISIIRCCNKVYLNELLRTNKVPTPKTIILDKKFFREINIDLKFPFILKIPDGSFSRGVHKISNEVEYKEYAKKLFTHSDIILAQEFVESDYDWRIGVLGGEALFASQYHMVKGHWQIYQHKDDGNFKSGKHKTIDIKDVPEDIVKTALHSAKLIGNGLYGVDIKMTNNGIYVMEVNDNPNIDAGVEDQIMGDELYKKIITHFIDLIES